MENSDSSLKKYRCLECKKKLGVDPIICKCKGMYCDGHRLPFNHNCSFDFKTIKKDELNKTMLSGKCVAEKVVRI